MERDIISVLDKSRISDYVKVSMSEEKKQCLEPLNSSSGRSDNNSCQIFQKKTTWYERLILYIIGDIDIKIDEDKWLIC